MTTPDFTSAYRVRCLSLDGHVGIFSGDEDPRTMDTSSFPVGSVYFQTDGTTWKRTGPAASAWIKDGQPNPRGDGCPWLQVVRAVQATSTEAQVLRLIQMMSMGTRCNHEHH
ncbi:MAG: hypothetical protein HQL76_06260 [Magnetococcales bacterium]|nr:hypothetical protein [Magnetococcales bacterium]